MKKCSNCGCENDDNSKFCADCGSKLLEPPKFCPECGTELNNIPKFCPECGFNLSLSQRNEMSGEEYSENEYSDDEYDNTSYLSEEISNLKKEYSDTWSELQESVAELERVSHEIKMSNSSRENDVYDEDYEEDYETTEEKIKKIVDKYIKTINKSNTAYTSGAVQNPEYSQVIQNVRTYIAKNVRQADIYGFIDVTLFGKGKSGLVFTNDRLYLKEPGGSITLSYHAITEMYIKSNSLYFENSKGYGTGLLNLDEVYISGGSYYNLPALKDCLEKIQAVL